MAKHLVTGGSGFIGSALVKELIRAGEQVCIIDDHSRGHPRRLDGFLPEVEILKGDIRDSHQVRLAVKGCEVIWHLAFINGTRFFYERPDDVLEVGIKGTLNTIDASLAEKKARRFIFASTSETYNQPTHVPTTESERLIIPDITNPRFSYGGGKITGELLTLHYAARRGLETVIVRPHNIYGPDMGFAHVIPEIIAKIFDLTQGGKKKSIELPIQGNGKETRAFCYIDDGATGFRIAGQKGAPGEIFHLGKSEEISIRDLIKLIGQVLGITLQIIPGPLRAGGTPRRSPEISKLSALGYRPNISLEEGIQKTAQWYWDWYQSNGTEAAQSKQ